jgi:hypothetical protein
MITNTKQRWQMGERVKVGFLRLVVIGNIGSQIKGFPESYRLVNPNTGRTYQFTPYNGLEKEKEIR